MDWQIILEMIEPGLFIMIPFIWAIGLFLKLYPKFKEEWLIPFILWSISLIFTILMMVFVLNKGYAPAVFVTSIIQGTLIAAMAVFGNEFLKQGLKKRQIDRLP